MGLRFRFPCGRRVNIEFALLDIHHCNGMFRWREEGEGVEGSRVELAKNKLILC